MSDKRIMKRGTTLILVCLVLAAGACRKKAAPGTPNPPAPTHSPPLGSIPTGPLPGPRPAPLPPIPAPTPIRIFQQAERDFENAKYMSAARGYEQYLKMPDPKNQPRALFHLGMSRLLSGGTPRDMRRAEVAFKTILNMFPDGPYRDQAEFILGLQAQIERLRNDVKDRDEKVRQLGEELQKLKSIDMQRKPTRPPN